MVEIQGPRHLPATGQLVCHDVDLLRLFMHAVRRLAQSLHA